MPALNEKAPTLLSSTTVDMKTAAATALYVVPLAKKCRILFVVVRDPTASLAGGTSYSVTNFRATFSLAGLTAGAAAYMVVQATDLTTYTETAANVTINWTVTTGSTAVANATIDLFGYLTD